MNFSQQGDLRGATLLTIEPTNKATFYAGTRSTDGGGHWQAVNNGLPVANIQLLALAPTPPSTLYVVPFFADLRRSTWPPLEQRRSRGGSTGGSRPLPSPATWQVSR